MSIAGRFGWRWYAGIAVAAAGLAPTTTTTPRPEPAPSSSPAARTLIAAPVRAIAGNVAFLDVNVPAGLHAAAFVDREPPAPGAAIPNAPGVVESAADPLPVPGLTRGAHRISVVLADAAHRRSGEAIDSVDVAVGGPTLIARAAPTSVEGEPWTITIAVSGVRLAAPDGDTTALKGHLEFLIEGALPPAGVAVPLDVENVVHTELAEVPLTGLEAGEHVVWIVLSDGTHRPFSPYVADAVRVTITR